MNRTLIAAGAAMTARHRGVRADRGGRLRRVAEPREQVAHGVLQVRRRRVRQDRQGGRRAEDRRQEPRSRQARPPHRRPRHHAGRQEDRPQQVGGQLYNRADGKSYSGTLTVKSKNERRSIGLRGRRVLQDDDVHPGEVADPPSAVIRVFAPGGAWPSVGRSHGAQFCCGQRARHMRLRTATSTLRHVPLRRLRCGACPTPSRRGRAPDPARDLREQPDSGISCATN